MSRCTKCSRESKPGRQKCAVCIGRSTEYRRLLRQLMLIAGKCWCGRRLAYRRKRCPECLRKDGDNKLRRVAEGRCISCGREPKAGCSHCQVCISRAAHRKASA